MTRLARWLKRTAREEAARPRLVDALLGYRAFRYVVYRLRMTTVRVLLRTALHLLEVAALSRVFSLEYLAPILLLRHSSALIQSFWWGGLECQREAVRRAHRRRDLGDHVRSLDEWSVLTTLVMLSSVLAYGAWLGLAPRPFDGFSIYDAYAIACALRTVLELWSRANHSAVFAIARIRRSLTSFLVVDIVEVFGLLLLWLRVGPFAFAVMLVVTGVLRAALTQYYTRATRVAIGLPTPSPTVLRRIRRVRWRELPYGRALGFAVGNLALQFESLAIVLLSSGGEDAARLSALLHGLSPLLSAGYVWSRIFYFDFKSVSRHASAFLSVRLGRLLDATALVFPCVLWGAAWPLVARLLPGLFDVTAWPIAGFIVARSVFSLRQVEAYSYVDWRVQVRQLALLLAGLGGVAMFVDGDKARLIGVSLALTLAAYAGRRGRPTRAEFRDGETLGFEAWLGYLAGAPGPLRCVTVTVDRRIGRMGAVQRALTEAGFTSPVLVLGRSRLSFVVDAGTEDETALRRRLLEVSAGTLLELHIGRPFVDGRSLIVDGFPECAEIGALLSRARGDVLPVDGLKAEFLSTFAEGTCLTATSGRLERVGSELRRTLGSLLLVAASQSAPVRSRRGLPVAAYCPFGRTSVLFVVPRSVARDRNFASFARRVSDASVAATFSALRSP
jgi:hypothetical protein